jgi:hypothetical protein
MKSSTIKTRRQSWLLAIVAVTAIAMPVLAGPSADLLNSVQSLKQEAAHSARARQQKITTTVAGTKSPAKVQLAAKTITLPAGQGSSSITVFIPSPAPSEPSQLEVAPVK